jgi:hypothetical protein
MDAPFIGNADQIADSGTALNILRQKYPGMFGPTGAPAPPVPAMFNSAPTIPAQTQVDPNSIPAPDVGQNALATPFVLPWLRQFQQNKADKLGAVLNGGLSGAMSQPQRPPLTQYPGGPIAPGANWKQALQVVIPRMLEGALAGRAAEEQAVIQSGGRRSGGIGMAAMAGLEQPLAQAQAQQTVQRGGLENQILGAQAQFAPQMQILNFSKVMADIEKNLADAGKATAEAGAVPIKSALENAQALAARYKEDPGSGQLIDLQNGTPFGNSTGIAPLSAEEAAILGKQEGERVPIKLKNVANEMVNRGIKSVSAGGRQLLVDGQGNTIKDLGQATPLVTMNAQMNAPQGPISADMQKAVDLVGKNQMDLATAMTPFRRFPGQAQQFLGALHDQYPNFFQGDFGSSKKVLEYFTSGEGGKSINAFNTATEHLGQLATLADNLNNTRSQAWNAAKNKVETWFGKAAPTNFDLVKVAVSGEVGKTFKGQVTDSELDKINAAINKAESPDQLHGAIDNALALMKSKMQANVEQYQQGRQGQPAFPNAASTPKFSQVKPGVMVEQ